MREYENIIICSSYIDKYKKKLKFSPISKGAFGGRVIKRGAEEYNNWNRDYNELGH